MKVYRIFVDDPGNRIEEGKSVATVCGEIDLPGPAMVSKEVYGRTQKSFPDLFGAEFYFTPKGWEGYGQRIMTILEERGAGPWVIVREFNPELACIPFRDKWQIAIVSDWGFEKEEANTT